MDVEGTVVNSTLMSTVDEHMQAFARTLKNEREKAIWHERLVAEDPVALAVLGERFSVSRERIRQIAARMKKQLKEYQMNWHPK